MAVQTLVMQIVVLANHKQRAELASNSASDIVWIEDEQAFLQYPSAAAYMDLKYFNTPERNALLKQLLPKPVIINSVVDTLKEIDPRFVRINGWPTFLSSPVIEAATNDEQLQSTVDEILLLLNKKAQWLADQPGFVAARIISMIVNEAYITLGEGVSTKDEINTAMELGTAFPYGPFSWAEKIGQEHIIKLLQKLSGSHQRLRTARLLIAEANKAY